MEVKSWRELNSGKTRRKLKKKSKHLLNQQNDNQKDVDSDFYEDKSKSIDSFSAKKILDDGLEAVYSDDNDNKDKKKYMTKIYTQKKISNKGQNKYRSINQSKTKVKKSNFKTGKIIVLFLFIVVFILLLGAWRFAGPQNKTDDFTMSIAGPNKVVAGEEGIWKIKYKNLSKVTLTRMELTVKYPVGLRVRSVKPLAINNSKTVWDIGELAAGAEGELEIKAQIFSDKEGSKQLSVAMVYQPENFSSDFIKEVNYEISLNKSPISIDYTGPEVVLPETEHDWSFSFKNSGENDFNNIGIRLITSDNFIMSQSEPEVADITKNDNKKIYLWQKKFLTANQQINYDFKGKFLSSGKNIEHIKIEFTNSVDGELKVLQEKEIDVPIMAEELLLDLTVNGKDKLEHIKSGEELDYQITIQNTSGQDLKNITATLKLTPELINWQTLKSPVQPNISQDGSIIFTADNYDKLKIIPKGEELKFDVKINLKDQFNPQIKLKANTSVQVGKLGDKERNDISFTTDYIISIVEQLLKFRTEANYYDDEGIPVGAGPLPPKVGEDTDFVLNFYINQISESFSTLTISAYLPMNVDWLGEEKLNNGVIGYNPTNRKINWVINNVNSGSKDLSASFKVRITPKIDDVGNVITLLSTPTLVGIKNNGESINLSTTVLDTNLAGALFGSGQGVVIE